MRPSLCVLLLLVGCNETTGDGDAATCTPGFGTLEVCIYAGMSSTTPSPGSEATARRSASDVPFVMRAPEGCTNEDLEVGTWEVSGDDGSGTCTTPFEPVTITECETTRLRVEYINYCVDG